MLFKSQSAFTNMRMVLDFDEIRLICLFKLRFLNVSYELILKHISILEIKLLRPLCTFAKSVVIVGKASLLYTMNMTFLCENERLRITNGQTNLFSRSKDVVSEMLLCPSKERRYTDLTLKLDDGVLFRCVLASQSDFFDTMFSSGMR